MPMNAVETPEPLATTAQQATALCADPAAFFHHSYTEMQSISRRELEELQLDGLRLHLRALAGRIPMVQKLADNQGITRIDSLEDIVPMLFEHTMYKAYPPSFLENGRFEEINRFLSKLCTFDLTTIDVSKCETIDDWMITMDRESPLLIMHSSGTSGTMSFLPMSRAEWDKFGRTLRCTTLQNFGEDPRLAYRDPIYAIYPFFRYGGSGHIRMIENYINHIAGSEERVFTAYPGRMSSDLLFLAARMRAAQTKGESSRLKIGPRLLARKSEYEQVQAAMPEHTLRFFANIAQELQGKRIYFWGAQNLLLKILELGRQKGLKHVFAPNSVIGTGGDVKDGQSMPADWRQQLCAFIGVDQIKMCYGMTEIKGLHNKCSQGHYHFCPWIVPYVLDPDTSKVLPRSGRVTGRAAFFDLSAETRWGGFISGDEMTVEWDQPCACGQTTVYAHDGITRYSQKRGGDDKINCAATAGAHQEAMSFLTSFQ
jgi:hypothetical protein